MSELALDSTVVLALVAVTAGGLVHGALGLGFPLIATPLIALITDVKTAIILTLAPTLTVNIISIVQGGHWQESLAKYWSIAIYVLIGSIAGTKLLIVSDPRPFKLLLAIVILMYLFSSSINRLSWEWIRRRPKLWGVGFGAAAGVMAGTVNVAVPVLIIYFTELRLAPLAMVQSLNLSFLAGKAAQAGTFAVSGYLHPSILTISMLLALVAGLALWVGIVLRQRIHADTYRRWLRIMLFIVAALLMVEFAAGL